MTYEYRCNVCGNEIEISQSISDSPKQVLFCPHCKCRRLVKRLISKTSFILKGNGWYKDGYSKSDKT